MDYNKFYNDIKGLTFECDCTQINIREWDRLMEGHKRANRTELKNILKRLGMRNLISKFYTGNPYNFYKTDTHIIFVWSAIEFFYKIER